MARPHPAQPPTPAGPRTPPPRRTRFERFTNLAGLGRRAVKPLSIPPPHGGRHRHSGHPSAPCIDAAASAEPSAAFAARVVQSIGFACGGQRLTPPNGGAPGMPAGRTGDSLRAGAGSRIHLVNLLPETDTCRAMLTASDRVAVGARPPYRSPPDMPPRTRAMHRAPTAARGSAHERALRADFPAVQRRPRPCTAADRNRQPARHPEECPAGCSNNPARSACRSFASSRRAAVALHRHTSSSRRWRTDTTMAEHGLRLHSTSAAGSAPATGPPIQRRDIRSDDGGSSAAAGLAARWFGTAFGRRGGAPERRFRSNGVAATGS